MRDEIFAVRASAHRIARLAGPDVAEVRSERDGWSRLDRDPRDVGATTRALACVLRLDDDGWLQVTAYAPDGSAADGPEAARTAGLPAGVGLLERVLGHTDPRYTDRARLTDACRALGVPPALLLEPGPATPPPATPAPRTEVVLVARDAAGAAADAPLTGQAAWTVPLGAGWSMQHTDGTGPATPATVVAQVLGDRQPAIACWWSADEAGFVLVHKGQPVAGHQWGGWAPDDTAEAGRLLAADFGVPDQAVSVTALLRRRDVAPADALAEVFALLGLPGAGLGRATAADLAAWSAATPAAIHTPHLGKVAAVRHAMREAPPENVLDELSARRPLWYRALNGAVAVAMTITTVVLVIFWRRQELSVWWVVASTLVTVSYAWGLRPARDTGT